MSFWLPIVAILLFMRMLVLVPPRSVDYWRKVELVDLCTPILVPVLMVTPLPLPRINDPVFMRVLPSFGLAFDFAEVPVYLRTN